MERFVGHENLFGRRSWGCESNRKQNANISEFRHLGTAETFWNPTSFSRRWAVP